MNQPAIHNEIEEVQEFRLRYLCQAGKKARFKKFESVNCTSGHLLKKWSVDFSLFLSNQFLQSIGAIAQYPVITLVRLLTTDLLSFRRSSRLYRTIPDFANLGPITFKALSPTLRE